MQRQPEEDLPETGRRFLAAITSAGVHIQVEHVLAGSSGVAIVLHNTAPAGDGGGLDQYLVSTLNVAGGQVDRIEPFLSEPSKIAAYFGR
jgi:hypothetical protein